MPKFILPDAPEGVHVVNDRYRFVNGEMPVSNADAPMIAKILCEYHGCELVYDQEAASDTDKQPAPDAALTVDNTKKTAESEVKPAKK